MIDVKRITILDEYDEPVLDDVSFHINKGDFVVIFGEEDSRAGLLHCIMGYHMYFSGAVRFSNDVHVVRYVPADVFYDGRMTAGEYFLLNGKRFDTYNIKLCVGICEKLGVDINEIMGEMTYEDNKIVQIVAAVCCDPDILIIDGAQQFVSPEKMNKLLSFLKKSAGSGTAIIYSCDNYETVKGYCDRYIMLYEGKVYADNEVRGEDIRQRVITIEGPESDTLSRVIGKCIATKNGRSSYIYKGPLNKILYILSKIKSMDYLIEEMTLAEELTNDYSRWQTL